MKRTTIILLAGLLLAGCERNLPRADAPRPRAVCFSPAITAMLFEMGLEDHIVGVTTYCTVPEGLDIPVVGSQLNIRAEPIAAVDPDVLLTQTVPRRFETVRKLKPNITIEYVRIETLGDIAATMERIAAVLDRPEKGIAARRRFEAKLAEVRRRVAGLAPRRALFVMGHRDPSVAGRDTFMNEMIEVAGGVNAAAAKYEGWKSVGVESILKLAPEVIVCQSGAAAADEARRYWAELARSAGRNVRVHVVTDKRWTIPTGRMADPLADRMADIIHPDSPREAHP